MTADDKCTPWWEFEYRKSSITLDRDQGMLDEEECAAKTAIIEDEQQRAEKLWQAMLVAAHRLPVQMTPGSQISNFLKSGGSIAQFVRVEAEALLKEWEREPVK